MKLELDKAFQHSLGEVGPSELGNVFLACVGAILMDGEGLSMATKRLADTHISLCCPNDMMSPTANVIPMGGLMEEEPQDKANMVPTRVPPPGYDCSAEFCEYCGHWLNGPRQMLDHKVGKKHKRAVNSKAAACLGACPEVAHNLTTALSQKPAPQWQ